MMRRIIIILFIISFPSVFVSCRQIVVFNSNSGKTTDRIKFSDADFIASDKTSLYTHVSSAENGDIIWLDENGDFNLSDTVPLKITKQIILASSRNVNNSNGALVFSNNEDLNSLPKIDITADNVRITGLRLIGPDSEIGDSFYVPQVVIGISCTSSENLYVDNCEISAWSFAAIRIKDSRKSRIKNNHIHHNRRKGLGYGVVLYGYGDALITHNTFDYNRHDISGSGMRTQSYEASYNTVLNQGNSHSFDMHGEWESDRVPDSEYAGKLMYIHHNNFCKGISYPSIQIRGIPFDHALIEYNSFPHSSVSDAVVQSYFYGNFIVRNNILKQNKESIKK